WTKGVPVEVVPFAYRSVHQRISGLHHTKSFSGLSSPAFELEHPVPVLREAARKAGPVVTDNGNFVFDVNLGRINNPAEVERALKMIPGVVEVGIFSRMASEAWFGKQDGTVYSRTP
ncbi:hypothetical protein EV182_007463, partial [Spiromyces aspiralis]